MPVLSEARKIELTVSEPKAITLLVISDIHIGDASGQFPSIDIVENRLREKIANVREIDPEKRIVLVGCGDFTAHGKPEEIDAVLDVFQKVQEEQNVPVVLVMGNHDFFQGVDASHFQAGSLRRSIRLLEAPNNGEPIDQMIHVVEFSEGEKVIFVGFSGYPGKDSIKGKSPRTVQEEVLRRFSGIYGQALRAADTMSTQIGDPAIVGCAHYPLSILVVTTNPGEILLRLGVGPDHFEAFGVEMDQITHMFAGVCGHVHSAGLGVVEGTTPEGIPLYDAAWTVREATGLDPILQLDVPVYLRRGKIA